MAARENQGLQIALIIFVILTISLIVSTYWFFNKYTQENDRNKNLTADTQKAQQAASTANTESEGFKRVIGAAATDKLEGVDAVAKSDFERYGKSIPEANQNYRFLIEQLSNELKSVNARNEELTAANTALIAKGKSDKAEHDTAVAEYKKAADKASADLLSVREGFDKSRKEMDATLSSITKKSEKISREFDELSKTSTDEIAALTTDNSKMKTLVKEINDRKMKDELANEASDGKITWVNQHQRTVWINLGSQDGLRRQTSFTVFGPDVANPIKENSKGKIEVVRLEGHRAEARIVDDDRLDPLMPGDQIYSPSWQPGTPEHFALAGFIDLNGDGESDRQKVRDMISRNGGVIDEEVDDQGKKSGEMSIHTRYLVLGDPPKAEGKKLESFSKIHTEAQSLGIRTIDVKEFMNYMGYKSEERAVNLGKFARPDDFKPRMIGNTQRVMPGNPIREPRRPLPARAQAPAEPAPAPDGIPSDAIP